MKPLSFPFGFQASLTQKLARARSDRVGMPRGRCSSDPGLGVESDGRFVAWHRVDAGIQINSLFGSEDANAIGPGNISCLGCPESPCELPDIWPTRNSSLTVAVGELSSFLPAGKLDRSAHPDLWTFLFLSSEPGNVPAIPALPFPVCSWSPCSLVASLFTPAEPASAYPPAPGEAVAAFIGSYFPPFSFAPTRLALSPER